MLRFYVSKNDLNRTSNCKYSAFKTRSLRYDQNKNCQFHRLKLVNLIRKQKFTTSSLTAVVNRKEAPVTSGHKFHREDQNLYRYRYDRLQPIHSPPPPHCIANFELRRYFVGNFCETTKRTFWFRITDSKVTFRGFGVIFNGGVGGGVDVDHLLTSSCS